MTMSFRPATKKQAKARIALAGPTGSGKTYTSLRIAQVLGKRIALLDTEHRSASKYADEFTFNTLPLDRYDPQLLIEALAVAAAEGHDVFIADSLSHFWMGSGGMLEQVDWITKRSASKNSFEGWKEMRPLERKMIEAMLAYPGHVIVTMRTKTEWVLEENERGKKVPKKIGTRPEQREGIEYEFDIVGDLDLENELIVSKTRCPALAGVVIKKPDEEFAHTILSWLDAGEASGVSAAQLRDEALADGAGRGELLALYQQAQAHALLGAPVLDGDRNPTILGDLLMTLGRAAAARRAPDGKITADQHKRMHALWSRLELDGEANSDARLARIGEIVGRLLDSSADLSTAEADQVIAALEQARAVVADAGSNR